MTEEFDRLIIKNYSDVPDDIRLYLVEALACIKQNDSVDDVFELIYPQIEVYYEDIPEEEIRDFSEDLYTIIISNAGHDDHVLKKLSSTVAIDGSKQAMAADVMLMDRALPDRGKVDKSKLAKIQAQQEAKKKKAADKAATQKIFTDEGVPLATVSQGNTQASLANPNELNFEDFDMNFGQNKLLINASIKFSRGHRYGLVGRNGSGKSTFLRLISSREFSFHPSMVIAHVSQELEASDTPALDSVLEADTERQELLERLKTNPPDLADIYAKLDEIGADEAPIRAAKVLNGLCFTHEDQKRPVKDFSGGWRMRLALAQALFSRPDVLLLDEPTNMLDMKAVLWLENYLNNSLS